ncbi:MAG: hypothetical protein WCI18_16665 [Pseudomonadota bacterium]
MLAMKIYRERSEKDRGVLDVLNAELDSFRIAVISVMKKSDVLIGIDQNRVYLVRLQMSLVLEKC